MATSKLYSDIDGETVELKALHQMRNAEFAARWPGVKGIRADSFTKWVAHPSSGLDRVLPVTRMITMKSNPSRHECNAKCLNGKHNGSCECRCGGKNHGRGTVTQSLNESTSMSNAISTKALVIQHLVSAGWTARKDESSLIASKDFDTASGVRTARANIYEPGANVDAYLSANYQDYGKNILEPLAKRIPTKATPDQVKEIVQAFGLSIESRINETHARQFHLTAAGSEVRASQRSPSQAQRERQMGCDHSFNDENNCEYCGLAERDHSQSCGDGNEIGTYR